MKDNGELVSEGDVLLRPKMASTLRTIANDPNAFYDRTSQLARDIVADVQEYGEKQKHVYVHEHVCTLTCVDVCT